MIKLKNIAKRYNTRAGFIYVLQQINLEIKEGEFITIMGPSGSGKTTLLNILGMLDGDWEGQYFLDENPVHELKSKNRMALNRQYIGFVFQSFNLLDSLTVYENLETPLSYRNFKSSERASIVCDTLDRFGIVGKKDLFPNQLSGGQQQLVGVARAVVASPKLILADEPTGNLHSTQGKDVMELLRKLNNEGTTIIQVTHNESYAAYGNRIINLKDGWISND
ncbi:MAG: ABC transporter ATP-binding protein [Sedimentisphaerales bacterium]|nr:ABC transporter ATP-binding protein [Sedimentisphaerales bacterium]